MYMSIPNSQFIPPPHHPSPLVTIISFSKFVSSSFIIIIIIFVFVRLIRDLCVPVSKGHNYVFNLAHLSIAFDNTDFFFLFLETPTS